MMQIGTQIKKYRNESGLSQDALAKATGYSIMAVSRWERNAVAMPADAAIKLANTVHDKKLAKTLYLYAGVNFKLAKSL